jgi:two-component system cell cycle sensor histidine kinase/response regulator CckA
MANAPKPQAAPFPSPTLAEDILNAVDTLICVVNGDGELIYVSPAVKRLLGYDVAEVLGQGWWERVYSGNPEVRAQVRDRLMRTARGEVPVQLHSHSAMAYAADGSERWFVWQDAKGPGDLLIGVGQDVTELQAAERMARRHEQEFRAVFENASEGMLILNDDWVYEQVNDAASKILGVPREQLVGKQHGEMLRSTLDSESFRAEAGSSGKRPFTTEFERPNGERRTVEVTITTHFRPGHHLLILHDVSEQRKLQAQLAEAHRLESIGRLAGGVAHDFNNMLTAIRGYAELLQRGVTDDKLKRYAEAILGATERAAGTTQRLLAFSRKQVLKPQVMELNEAISSTADLLRRLLGEDIELSLVFSPDTGRVLIDPSQFSQILMNIAVNARDAMASGGKLIIETRPMNLDDDYVLGHANVRPGRYALIAITDTGTGIPPEIVSHIFEPFFTTKEQGKGTGLGLATVHGLVAQSGGYVWVYSEPGQGTTFKIYLPQVGDDASPDSTPAKATILVIEDDETIRTATVQALEAEGYRVLSAADGTEALSACQRFSDEIEIVLTDVLTSGMSGEDLMGYFAVKYPTIGVIHMSGFARARLEEAHTFFPEALFLPKPFTMAELREKVEMALERRAAHRSRE